METFGPEKYVRSDGAPDVYSEVFETIPGPGKIFVGNGEYNGEKRVPYAISSARVYVNGLQIFGPNDFSRTVYHLEADIDLTENNSIMVELASQPGDFLTVSVEQEIPPPSISTLTASPESIGPGESSTIAWQRKT